MEQQIYVVVKIEVSRIFIDYPETEKEQEKFRDEFAKGVHNKLREFVGTNFSRITDLTDCEFVECGEDVAHEYKKKADEEMEEIRKNKLAERQKLEGVMENSENPEEIFDAILNYLKENPGESIFAIAEGLGKTAKDIVWHINHLVRNQKIERRDTEIKTEYWLMEVE